MVAAGEIGDRILFRKPVFTEPGEKTPPLVVGLGSERIVHPLVGRSTGEDDATDVIGIFLLRTFQQRFEAVAGCVEPEITAQHFGNFAEAVAGLPKTLQLPHQPRGRIQVHHQEEFRIWAEGENVVELPVERLEIVTAVPEPDRRIFRIGLPERVDRIGREEAELTDPKFGEPPPRRQLLAERTVGEKRFPLHGRTC